MNFSDDTAKNIWNNVLKGAEIEQAVRNIFGAPKEAVGVLGTLQLQRACDNILNALTAGLNASYAHYDTQLTEKDFNAKFGPLVNVLKEVSEDLKNIGSASAFALGITDSTGSWSIKTRSVKVVDPEQAQKEKYITQIYAALPDEENSGMGEGIGLKELLPHDEAHGSPLAKGLVERLSTG